MRLMCWFIVASRRGCPRTAQHVPTSAAPPVPDDTPSGALVWRRDWARKSQQFGTLDQVRPGRRGYGLTPCGRRRAGRP